MTPPPTPVELSLDNSENLQMESTPPHIFVNTVSPDPSKDYIPMRPGTVTSHSRNVSQLPEQIEMHQIPTPSSPGTYGIRRRHQKLHHAHRQLAEYDGIYLPAIHKCHGIHGIRVTGPLEWRPYWVPQPRPTCQTGGVDTDVCDNDGVIQSEQSKGCRRERVAIRCKKRHFPG